jgi:hypothetical protein
MSGLQSALRAFKKPRVAKIGHGKKEEPATTGRAYSVLHGCGRTLANGTSVRCASSRIHKQRAGLLTPSLNKREKPGGRKSDRDSDERRADRDGGASANFSPVHPILALRMRFIKRPGCL